jgi:LmbE family N-acetylglucosaminyl deacetylase
MISTIFVSPHPDDICFSSFLAATSPENIERHIVTVFSRSRFWLHPTRNTGDPNEISNIRRAEELRFAQMISATHHDLGYPDSSLRYSHGGPEYGTPALSDTIFESVYNSLKESVNGIGPANAVYVPIGISRHVDHLICRDAILRLPLSCPVVFYEDLPYISRYTDGEINAFVSSFGFQVSAQLLYAEDGGRAKVAAIEIYKTQLEGNTIELIAGYGHRLAGAGAFAERYWRLV